jgi:hypothetical protein
VDIRLAGRTTDEHAEIYSRPLAYFFDLEASEIVLITDEVNGDLRKLYKELDDTRPERVRHAIEESNLPSNAMSKGIYERQVIQGQAKPRGTK